MTPKEFKAWFDGFTECMDSTPNEKQWKRIKERVAEIDGRETTVEIYRDRYYGAWPRRYYGRDDYQIWFGNATCNAAASPATLTGAARPNLAAMGVGLASWNSAHAMFALGKADAESIE